ncbi:lantibiotic modifying enzyme [Clostridium beijerinckii]|uniref:type 2 lanthipeptide synthetase LanM family protein n=1 Tax=Clostridium beijerinckii TaxID=1520 RepID=UPI001494A069|nr:type 2 lanthipeptide synthetase LanM family protein [Clostridium beijerinckii]NOW89138.1 lantibiotic modifying enzyme [Clostridium beijerinckii]
MELNLAKTLTTEEKISLFKGNLLEKYKANKVIDEWIKNDNMLSYDNLIKKLELEGIDFEKFATIVSEKEIDNQEVSYAKWYELYKNIISEYSNVQNYNFYNEESIMYFLNAFIYWCNVQLNKEICKYNNIKIHSNQIDGILSNIGKNLFNICSKTIVYEYYNQEKQNFKFYNVSNFKNVSDLQKFFAKYPVMLRRLVVKVECLLNTYIESFFRIDRDFKEITEKLDIKLGNIITNITGNLGDTHEKGKFVIKYEFNNTTKIIYKPKDLNIAKKFYNIISWINKNCDCEKIAIPNNYYNSDYTVEEYIEATPCENEDQIMRYYERLGQLIAITFLLSGNDFHKENIVANGEFPYLIDLETLFNQPITIQAKDIFDYNNLRIQDSINRTSFLPSNSGLADENGNGIDISGLSYKDQKLPYKILKLMGGVDNPRFDYVECEIKAQNNIPILDKQKIGYIKYKSCIKEGFLKLSKFIIKNKFEFLKQIEVFKNTKVRQLMRSTINYARILEYASHPKYTVSMLNFQKMVYYMWEYPFNDKRLITSEVEDLLYDDIPLFKTITTSRDLIDSKGRIIKNYFNKSALDHVKERIINFDEKSVNRQLDYLNIAINNSKNVIDKKLRMKNELYKFNKSLVKDVKCENLDILLNDINQLIEYFSIKYENQCIWENLINGKIKLESGYSKGILGIYYYLYMYNNVNGNSSNNLKEIIAVFSNEKFLNLGLFNNKIQDLLDFLSIIDCTLGNTFNTDILNLKSRINEVLNKQLDNGKLSLSMTIKSIKVLGKLYIVNKSYDLKKTISKLKDNLEIQLLTEGLTNLKYDNDVSVIDLLDCIILINSIYPNKGFNFNLEYIKELNNKYFEQIYKLESIEFYNNKEYRNIIRSLSLNISNNHIEYNQLKRFVLKIIKEKEIDENIIFIIDILINLYLKNKDQEIKKVLDEKMKDLEQYYAITNNYPIDEMNHFKNLSIENGLSGIGYEILRYFNNRIPSIINMI